MRLERNVRVRCIEVLPQLGIGLLLNIPKRAKDRAHRLSNMTCDLLSTLKPRTDPDNQSRSASHRLTRTDRHASVERIPLQWLVRR
jgi:hypothetical protein